MVPESFRGATAADVSEKPTARCSRDYRKLSIFFKIFHPLYRFLRKMLPVGNRRMRKHAVAHDRRRSTYLIDSYFKYRKPSYESSKRNYSRFIGCREFSFVQQYHPVSSVG